MARPKTLKKPSQKRLERAARKTERKLRRSHGFTFFSGGIGDYTGNGYANFTGGRGGPGCGTVSITSTNATSGGAVLYTTNRFAIQERQVVIESLDEGVTWHTADTMEPSANRDGKLIVGTADWGPAPETMRPGSGVYRHTFTCRGATDAEAAEWMTQQRGADCQRHADDQRALAVQRQTTLDALEQARRLLERAERTRREEDERRERAKVRAEDLLLSHLTSSQQEDLKTKDGFWVTSQFGNRYWVTRSTAVRFDENGVALQRYCIHAVDYEIPPEDNALMRKLVLECDEELFLRTANPGQPSRWDLERRQPIQFVNPASMQPTPAANGVIMADYVSMANQPVDSPGATANVTISSGAATAVDEIPNVDLRVAPVLFWVNGVVRPLTG